MPVFRFRLAAVLRYRQRLSEEKQEYLQALERAQERVVAEIQKQEQLILQQATDMEEQRGKIVSPLDLRLQGDFSQHMTERIRELSQLLTTVQKRIEDQRSIVAQADREVKSLEQLRTRLWERHRQEEKNEEQKIIDEIGQQRHYDRQKRHTIDHKNS
jgi:flagellar export protein FliJ